MPDSDKPGGILPPNLKRVYRQRWTRHLPLRLLGWLCWPIGGWRLIALLTLHRKAGWYYCGRVGDAYHHSISGPYPTKSEAIREGRGRISSLYHDHLIVFHSWNAPSGSYDPRKAGYVRLWFLAV